MITVLRHPPRELSVGTRSVASSLPPTLKGGMDSLLRHPPRELSVGTGI